MCQRALSFLLCCWNVSCTWNMSSRRETSPVLITAQPNKPVLHDSFNIAIFTWEARPVIYSCAAFPYVLLTPAEQGVLHQGHNGWFDLKRSNYPQQWSDLIVYWRRRESVIEAKLEVIVSERCGEDEAAWLVVASDCLRIKNAWYTLIGGWGPWGGQLHACWYQRLLGLMHSRHPCAKNLISCEQSLSYHGSLRR